MARQMLGRPEPHNPPRAVSVRSKSSHYDFASTPVPCPLGLALVQAAGGDARLLEGLRALAWEAYLNAGAPWGHDETGLQRWWSDRIGASRN